MKSATFALVLFFIPAKLISLAPLPPTQPDAYCKAPVFLYVDVSESISEIQELNLANVLTKAINASGPIPVQGDLYLIPFAGDVGQEHPVDRKDAAKEIISLFQRTRQTDEFESLNLRQTNIINMLKDIEKRLESSYVKNSRAVFVVVSDFEHDVTNEGGPAARAYDEKNWDEESAPVLGKLGKSLRSPSGPVLLFFPVKSMSSTQNDNLGGKVIESLRRIVPYDNRIYDAEGEAVNNANLIQYFSPIALLPNRYDGGVNVGIKNVGCYNLPDMQLEAVTEKTNIQLVIPNRDCPFKSKRLDYCVVSVPLASQGSAWHPEQGVTFSLKIKDKSQAFQEQRFDVAEYIFVDQVTAHFTSLNRELDVEASGRAVTWGPEKGVITLTLLDHMQKIAGPVELDPPVELAPDLYPRSFKAHSSMNIAGKTEDLARICLNEKGEHLQVRVEIKPGRMLAQGEPLDVEVTPHDGQGDLLRELVQHGSFPALATLLTLTAMTIRRREASLAHIHEVLGVAGFWLVLFVLLHRIVSVARVMDVTFVGGIARLLALAVALALSLTGLVMHCKGVLSPAKGEAEITLRMARKEMPPVARASWFERLGAWLEEREERRRKVYGSLRFILIVCIPLVTGLFIAFSDQVDDCTFVAKGHAAASEIESHALEVGGGGALR